MDRRKDWRFAAGLSTILLLGALLRSPPLLAGRPYTNYVDEGNLLHPVAAMLRAGTWIPGTYLYPQLPGTVIVAVLRASAPLYAALHDGHTISSDVSPDRDPYDQLEPFALTLTGRALSLLAGLGVICLSAMLARRLFGPASGLFAAFVAACLPCFVLRGAIATVDPWATVLALGCLYFADRLRTSARPRDAVLAGVFAGLAGAAKYPAVLVAVAAGLPILLSTPRGRERLRLVLLGGLGVVVGTLAGMPAWVLEPRTVLSDLRLLNDFYSTHASSATIVGQAVERAEWDLPYEHPEIGLPLLLIAAAGAALMLADRKLRTSAASWLLFGGFGLALYLGKSYQPFRNLLPLVPLLVLFVAAAHARARAKVARRRWVDFAAALVVVALFAAPLATWMRGWANLRDSRREAIDWLSAKATADQTVLMLGDLGILGTELRRLASRVVTPRSDEFRATLFTLHPDLLVVGEIGQAELPAFEASTFVGVRRNYRLRARFGESPTTGGPGQWHGNRQIVAVYERLPAGQP